MNLKTTLPALVTLTFALTGFAGAQSGPPPCPPDTEDVINICTAEPISPVSPVSPVRNTPTPTPTPTPTVTPTPQPNWDNLPPDYLPGRGIPNPYYDPFDLWIPSLRPAGFIWIVHPCLTTYELRQFCTQSEEIYY